LSILVLVAAGCSTASSPPGPPPEATAPSAAAEDRALSPPIEERAPELVRGFGAVTARVPGTKEVVTGVRLLSHHVSVVVRDRFARTEVVEELANDTGRVLEGRFSFPVPPDAGLSRLALWVGKELVEGEIVERERANGIFDSIVDYVPRPRDPALLEWVKGSELSLRIFPFPPHGIRKVVLAYEQSLPAPAGRARYVYPLSLGPDRSARVGDFSLHVSVDRAGEASVPGYAAAAVVPSGGGIDVSFAAAEFTPSSDFVLSWDEPAKGSAPPAESDRDRFVAVRVPVVGGGAASPGRLDRAVILDVSHSQSKDTLAGEVALAAGLIAGLDPDERFALLACDSACASYPEDGLSEASPSAVAEARAWLARLAPAGSSDLAGALRAAARRLDAGQIVYVGDGAPTSGDLTAETIAARIAPDLAARRWSRR
jgi:Ca-activated chloride channel family protein